MDVLEEHCISTFIVQRFTLKVEILSSCEMLLPELRLHVVGPEVCNMNHHHEYLKSQKLVRLIKEMNWQYCQYCDELV